MYIGKTDSERRCKQRLYLWWNLGDLLDIISGTGKVEVTDTFYQNFNKLLTFSQLHDFVKYHKEYCYNQNIHTDHVYVKYAKIASCLERD